MSVRMINIRFITSFFMIIMFVPAINSDIFLKSILIAVSAIGVILAISTSLIRRPCGHGFISTGKTGLIFYPWAIKKCPVCGDDFSKHCGKF